MFELGYNQMSMLRIEGMRGVQCYTCGGPSKMCSDHYQEELVQCYPNVTTCSVGRIRDKLTNELLWGASCGPESLKLLSEYHCEKIELDRGEELTSHGGDIITV